MINHKKILIIDDENVICDACEMILSEKGFQVDKFNSGGEGLPAALNGSYDLILLDIKLGDMDGIDILEKIKNKRPDSYIIVITGLSTVSNTISAMKAGANDYLPKPFSDDELISAIEQAFKNIS